jgi:3-methyladenine DNA glycosylase AlkC
MVEPFKLLINAQLVRHAATRFARVLPGFPRARFESLALDGLDALELKARAMQITSALEQTLPQDFALAATAIEATLAPVDASDTPGTQRRDTKGLAGWICWPLGEYIARRGLHDPQRALAALHALTQRFSAEFAIRPFILAHPALVFDTLSRWASDPSEHVRRLAREGSRPRLPWGIQLKPLIADPSPSLPLLRALQDDPSEYVRRSVANHLNDIAKDHPQRVAEWLETHLPDASVERRRLLRHASRTLIKRADPRVLAAWGLGGRLRGEATLTLSRRRVALGGAVGMQVLLRSTARRAQVLAIDYVVHHVKADGSTSPKVFKGWQIELAPGELRELTRQHSFKPITTRRYYPGEHRVTLQVNGQAVAEASFTLRT